MSRHTRFLRVGLVCLLAGLIGLGGAGCQPARPFYLGERGDLAHYLEAATELEYPDADHDHMAEAAQSHAPVMLTHPEFAEFWDLCLEEAISISLQNSKVMRNLGTVVRSPDNQTTAPDLVLARPESVGSVYDAAVSETDPQRGVEGALAAFDAQLSSRLFWEKTDRISATTPARDLIDRDQLFFDVELSKRTAAGTEFAARYRAEYDSSDFDAATFNTESTFHALEAEMRQPLLRGRGAQVNRIPVVLARINTDVTLADFEANVRNLLYDVERAYWDLFCAYRVLQANKDARDRALDVWQVLKADKDTPAANEAVSRAQYFQFQVDVENAFRDLLNKENNLRWLMGLAATDGRLIRPCEEPATARVCFEWVAVQEEALCRSAELRRQQWRVKQREMELILARNQLLPQLDATVLYRFLEADPFTAGGTAPDSRDFDSLTPGDYQEIRVGVEFDMPIGFRRELAGVRNSQVSLAREKARLEDMELNVSHLLTLAVRDLDAFHVLAETNLNNMTAADAELSARRAAREEGNEVQINFELDAQRRKSQAEIAYYIALCNYNKAIANVHLRKGSLLDYDGVMLAEGPWPSKAYDDALGHAKRRDAATFVNYGWSRPRVISQGPVPQNPGHNSGMVPAGPGLPQTPRLAPTQEDDGEEIPRPTPDNRPDGDEQPKEPDRDRSPSEVTHAAPRMLPRQAAAPMESSFPLAPTQANRRAAIGEPTPAAR